MLNFALDYHRLGLTPIKLCKDGKKPVRPWKHLQGALPEKESVIDDFKTSDCNIGVVTGPPTGLIIIDIDRSTEEQQQAARDEIDTMMPSPLPWNEAPCVSTCNRGLHYWFRSQLLIGNRAGLVDRVDVRGNGGYIVTPPSKAITKQGGVAAYHWLNPLTANIPQLTDEQALVLQPPKSSQAKAYDADPTIDYNHQNRALTRQGWGEQIVPEPLKRCYVEVAHAKVGTRNDTLNRAAFHCAALAAEHDMDISSIEAELRMAASMAGLSEQEITTTLTSAIKAGISSARNHREYKPSKLPFTVGSEGYDYQSRYLVKGLIPADSFGVVYGPSGHFKSFIALALACHISTGRDWNGHRTQRSKVLYVAGEGGTGVPRRIRAWESKSSQGGTVRDLAVISQPVYLTEERQLDALVDSATEFGGEQGVGLIILDTLARCFAGADENKTADMNQFIAKCDELRRRTGATVLVVHHSGKDAEKGARGSSALRAAADFEFSVKRTEDDSLAAWLACTKMKDDGGASDMAFPLRVVELFTDSDGDPVTSLVVSDEGYVPEGQDEAKAPPGKNQMALWEAVRSRQAKGESTHSALIRDDLKKLGLDTKNYSRWITTLINRGSIRVEDDNLITI